jgi:hypothetical protein
MPPLEQNLSPEQNTAQEVYYAEIKTWRMKAPMEKFIQLKKMFYDAGVGRHIVNGNLRDGLMMKLIMPSGQQRR